MSAAYKLAALDMDGTLLNTNHQVTPRTREVLKRCAEADKLIALATGRCFSELRAYLESLPGIAYVIGENGASVYDPARTRTLLQMTMDDQDVDYIFSAARELDVLHQVFIGNQSYMGRFDAGTLRRCHILDFMDVFLDTAILVDDVEALCGAHPGQVEKVNLYFSDPAERDRCLLRLAERGLAVSGSIGMGCECSPVGADKGAGLRALCKAIGVPIAQTLSVGDGGNDLELMAAAGFSVAMGNAIEPVKALAHAVTADCDHDGCALALERYLLNDDAGTR